MTTTGAAIRVGRRASVNNPCWVFSPSCMSWVGLPTDAWRKQNPDVIQILNGEQTTWKTLRAKVSGSVNDKMWHQGFVALALACDCARARYDLKLLQARAHEVAPVGAHGWLPDGFGCRACASSRSAHLTDGFTCAHLLWVNAKKRDSVARELCTL